MAQYIKMMVVDSEFTPLMVISLPKELTASKARVLLSSSQLFNHAVLNICNTQEIETINEVKTFSFKMHFTSIGFVLQSKDQKETALLELLAKKVHSVFEVLI